MTYMTVHIELGHKIKWKAKMDVIKPKKYFFSINVIWNRCHHHYLYGKNNMQYMQTGGFNVLLCILLFLYTIIYRVWQNGLAYFIG
jgi:hypothetical protein